MSKVSKGETSPPSFPSNTWEKGRNFSLVEEDLAKNSQQPFAWHAFPFFRRVALLPLAMHKLYVVHFLPIISIHCFVAICIRVFNFLFSLCEESPKQVNEANKRLMIFLRKCRKSERGWSPAFFPIFTKENSWLRVFELDGHGLNFSTVLLRVLLGIRGRKN